MKFLSSGVMTLFIVVVVAGFAYSAQNDSPKEAFRLGEIVVSAVPEKGVEKVGTLYRVTAQEIKDKGARTLDQALRLVPGLIIREGAEGTPRIDIRGFRTRHVQLFLDGIPIRDTFDGQFDPTRIPAMIIAEIKVTAGGSSVLYGPGGNGGAIDIITIGGQKETHGSISGEVGEGGRYLGKASFSGGGEKFDFYAGFNHFKRNKLRLSDDFQETKEESGNWRENSDRERSSFFGNLGYQLGEQTRLGLVLGYQTGENGKPPVTNYNKSDPFTKKVKYERIDDFSTNSLQLSFNHNTEGPLSFRGWGFYSNSDVQESRYDDNSYATREKNGAYKQDSDTEIYGVSTQVLYGIGDSGTVTLGLNATNDNWDADGYSINKSKKAIDFSSDYDIQVYSMALEYEQKIADRVEIVAGYGHHFQERDDGNDNDFSYLVGTSLDLTKTTQLRLNHARKIRFPSIKQLYDGDSGNPDLDTEVTLHYEIGIQQQLPAEATFMITGFIIDAKDFIEKDASDENRNYQDIRFKGIETEITMSPLDQMLLRLAVTWLDTKDKSSDRDELQYRPEWTISAEGRYRFEFGLTAYASIQHIANQYFYDDDDKDPLEKKKLDNFTVVNLKLSQPILNSGFEIYAGADNLFDEEYEESYGLPQPGRTIFTGVEYHF